MFNHGVFLVFVPCIFLGEVRARATLPGLTGTPGGSPSKRRTTRARPSAARRFCAENFPFGKKVIRDGEWSSALTGSLLSDASGAQSKSPPGATERGFLCEPWRPCPRRNVTAGHHPHGERRCRLAFDRQPSFSYLASRASRWVDAPRRIAGGFHRLKAGAVAGRARRFGDRPFLALLSVTRPAAQPFYRCHHLTF